MPQRQLGLSLLFTFAVGLNCNERHGDIIKKFVVKIARILIIEFIPKLGDLLKRKKKRRKGKLPK